MDTGQTVGHSLCVRSLIDYQDHLMVTVSVYAYVCGGEDRERARAREKQMNESERRKSRGGHRSRNREVELKKILEERKKYIYMETFQI